MGQKNLVGAFETDVSLPCEMEGVRVGPPYYSNMKVSFQSVTEKAQDVSC